VLDNAAICFEYATEPLLAEVDKSNPCEFVAAMSAPVKIGVAGFTPSNPCWNPTINCAALFPTVNEPPFVESKPNTEFEPTPAPVGIGYK
jgi:hypothetical protein